MGRRILVRWDLTVGPDDRDMVIKLPEGKRLTSGELRPTVARINSVSADALVVTMNDPSNWVGLLTHFDYERALSGYIAAYPHRLEDGLLPHPNEKVRERVFSDRTRSDVLLEDRDGRPVVVECKQGAPTVENVKQLRGYMTHLVKETGMVPRGILVHGGSRKLSPTVLSAAQAEPTVEIVQYELDVAFSACK
jgi:RecB family endonuclease NucS